MPEPLPGHGRYMAGLDGLRTVAVFAVIAYHLNLPFAAGGLLGVGVFFVLSGYLITDILADQWGRDQRLDLKQFWLRRARRLLPALLVMLGVVVIWITLIDRSQMPALREEVLAAVLYVSNWWFIFHKVSYFASFGPLSPLGHLWSLAVEEQFYLFWPLLLAFGLRYVPKRSVLAVVVAVGAVVSALAMALLYQPGTDPSRVYYGTDTRAFALLIGATVALVWPSRKPSATLSPRARLALDVSGAVTLLVVLAMIGWSSEYDAFLYQGGMVLLSVATAVVVAVLAHPASRLSKVLGCLPLRWLGVRSYGIYLWHYPVIVLTSPTVNTGGVEVGRSILQVAVSIVLAALSWRFLEEPIRHGAIGKAWGQIREGKFHWKSLRASRIVAFGVGTGLSVSCLTLIGYGLVTPSQAVPVAAPFPIDSRSTVAAMGPAIQPTDSPSEKGASHHSDDRSKTNTTNPDADNPSKKDSTTNADHSSSKGGTTKPTDNSQPTAGATKPSDSSSQPNATTPTPATKPQSGQGITAIGDSVMVDVGPYLEKLLPGIVVDGKVGRQLYQTPSVVADLKNQGRLGSTVILELGTNGPFTQDQLSELLNSLGDVKQIFLINTRVPRPWQDEVNSMLAEAAASNPHITLVNWYTASAGKDSYFYPDGVHPNPEGSAYYASMVAKAIVR